MSTQDVPESTATVPLSLKSITQQLLLDTLQPDQRISLAETILDRASDDDLACLSLTAIERCVAARAAAPITQALLTFLPQLKGRIKATDHEWEDTTLGEKMWYKWTSTTYLVENKDGDERTLIVDTVRGFFGSNMDGENWSKATFRYEAAGSVTEARFAYTDPYGRCEPAEYPRLVSSHLDQLFHTLAEDLSLPILSSPSVEVWEQEQFAVQEEKRAHLRREVEAATAPHANQRDSPDLPGICRYSCVPCAEAWEYYLTGLDLLELPKAKYAGPDLATPDAQQRATTFGRLVRGLLPRGFRNETMHTARCKIEFMDPDWDTMEELLVGSAVAGVDLSEW